MNKVIRIISAVMVGILCFACFAACSTSVQPWTDKNVVFTYDNNGNVTITFPDNYEYDKNSPKVVAEFGGNSYVAYTTLKEYIEDMKASENNSFSVYLVKILRKLSVEECEKVIPNYNEEKGPYMWSTYYEAVIVFDYLQNKEINKQVYCVTGARDGESYSFSQQFQNGDTLVGFMSNHDKGDGVCRFAFDKPCLIVDDEITLNTYIYDTKINYEDVKNTLPADEKASEYTKNIQGDKRIFNTMYKLSDFISYVKNLCDEVGYEIK